MCHMDHFCKSTKEKNRNKNKKQEKWIERLQSEKWKKGGEEKQ